MKKFLTGKSILIVDDNADLREILSATFEEQGGTVLLASDGRTAFELINRNKIDVLISDIKMPGGDGFELLGKISTFPSKPIIVLMSGFSDLTYAEANWNSIVTLLHKPFKKEDLFGLIQKQLK